MSTQLPFDHASLERIGMKLRKAVDLVAGCGIEHQRSHLAQINEPNRVGTEMHWNGPMAWSMKDTATQTGADPCCELTDSRDRQKVPPVILESLFQSPVRRRDAETAGMRSASHNLSAESQTQSVEVRDTTPPGI
jgi:hypothetical protein